MREIGIHRHDWPALSGIAVGAAVSGLLTVGLWVGAADNAPEPAPRVTPSSALPFPAPWTERRVIDHAVIRIGPGLSGIRVRMSGPESPATGWHRPDRSGPLERP